MIFVARRTLTGPRKAMIQPKTTQSTPKIRPQAPPNVMPRLSATRIMEFAEEFAVGRFISQVEPIDKIKIIA